MVRYVAGDIGGTNSRLQLLQLEEINGTVNQETEKLVAEETYPSQQYSTLTFIIQKFLAKYVVDGEVPIACCLAVAGPVRANKSTITNVNWTLDGEEMAEALKMRKVQIINDFVAVGYGVLALERDDVIPINDVPITEDGVKCCIGAGTGLGEAFLTNSGREYDVYPSEGGHADFAPRDEIEYKLMDFFTRTERTPRVSVERLVSGMGIPRIYDFYCSLHPEEINQEVQSRIRTEDPGSVIAEFAKTNKCNLCRQTIDTFISNYGAEAGNLALKMLPFGGMYIAGGIAPKLMWAMQKDHLFWHNFVNKGRMRGLLEKIPVYVVVHKQVGLLGAKVVCRRLLRSEGFSIRGELSHFVESAPRNVDMLGLGSFGGTSDSEGAIEANIDTTGKQVGSVTVKRVRRRKDDVVTHAHVEAAMFRSALYGGALASVATVAFGYLLTYVIGLMSEPNPTHNDTIGTSTANTTTIRR